MFLVLLKESSLLKAHLEGYSKVPPDGRGKCGVESNIMYLGTYDGHGAAIKEFSEENFLFDIKEFHREVTLLTYVTMNKIRYTIIGNENTTLCNSSYTYSLAFCAIISNISTLLINEILILCKASLARY